MMISLDDSFSVSDQVISRDLDREAVILNLDTGTYFGLDEVGTRMWDLIAEHGSLRRVLDNLVDEYEASPEVLQSDLLRLVGELFGKGLLRVAGAAQRRSR
jgi:hypothetical protein